MIFAAPTFTPGDDAMARGNAPGCPHGAVPWGALDASFALGVGVGVGATGAATGLTRGPWARPAAGAVGTAATVDAGDTCSVGGGATDEGAAGTAASGAAALRGPPKKNTATRPPPRASTKPMPNATLATRRAEAAEGDRRTL